MSTLTGKVRGVNERRATSGSSTGIYPRIEPTQLALAVLPTVHFPFSFLMSYASFLAFTSHCGPCFTQGPKLEHFACSSPDILAH